MGFRFGHEFPKNKDLICAGERTTHTHIRLRLFWKRVRKSGPIFVTISYNLKRSESSEFHRFSRWRVHVRRYFRSIKSLVRRTVTDALIHNSALRVLYTHNRHWEKTVLKSLFPFVLQTYIDDLRIIT